jgi:hypothetical protein
MAVRIESKDKQPTEEDLKKLKEYAKDAENHGFKVVYSNDPNSPLNFPPISPYEQKLTLDVTTLLKLPDHLRKTAQAVLTLGRATAYDVAEQTRRARAVESGYLNQLVIMGHLNKERVSRKAYFSVAQPQTR